MALRSATSWVVLVVLAAGAVALLVQAGAGSPAGGSAPAGGASRQGGVFAVAGQIGAETYGLYLVNLEHGTIVLYEWVPQARTLRLLAARTYEYDSRLDEYNTEISPREVRKLAAQQKRLTDAPGPD